MKWLSWTGLKIWNYTIKGFRMNGAAMHNTNEMVWKDNLKNDTFIIW